MNDYLRLFICKSFKIIWKRKVNSISSFLGRILLINTSSSNEAAHENEGYTTLDKVTVG